MGKQIRKLLTEGRGDISPEEELSWFINDRKENVQNNIKPGLANNNIVILDRYYYSTAAYQGALGLDPEWILRENEAFAPKPDIVFLFIATPEKCLERIQNSRTEKSAFERLEYLQQVQQIFDSFNDSSICRIDTTPPQAVVHETLRNKVTAMLSGQGKRGK